MTDSDRFPHMEVRSAAELREWLSAHHTRAESVWLVTYLKHTGTRYTAREEVLDELLCFGWIDGERRKVDDERTMQLISPRRTHAWTQSYRTRAQRLALEGRLAEPGLRAIEIAQSTGQ